MRKKKQGQRSVVKKGTDFSVDDSSLKSDGSAITDPLQESPALADLNSKGIVEVKKKGRKRKRKNTKQNVDGCEVKVCPGENEEKDENMPIKSEEKSNGECGIKDCSGGLGQGVVHTGPDLSLDDSLVKADAAMKDSLHEPSVLHDSSASELLIELKTKKSKKRKRKNTKHNVDGCEVKVCPGENEEKDENLPIKDEEKSNGECGIQDCSGGLDQGVVHTGPDFSLDDSSVKADAAMKDSLHEPSAVCDLSASELLIELKTKKSKKRKRKNTEHNVDGCDTPESTLSKTCTPALDMLPEQKILFVSTDAVGKQSSVDADICEGENEIKEKKVLIKDAEKSNGECGIRNCSADLGQDVEHTGPDFSFDDSLVKTEAAIKDSLHEPSSLPDISLDDSSGKTGAAIKVPLHEPSVLPDFSSSERIIELKTKKRRKRKWKNTEQNVAKSNLDGCDTPEQTIQCVSTEAVVKQSCVETDICLGESEEKDENMPIKEAEKSNQECDIQDCSGDLGQRIEHSCPDVSLADSPVKTDAAIKDPIHEPLALPHLSSSKEIVEVKKKKPRWRKRTKTQHDVAKSNVNGCGTPENTSTKTSTPGLDMPTVTIQCVSTDAAIKQSFVEADIFLGKNEEEDHDMIIKDAEKSKGECDIQDCSGDLGQDDEHTGPDLSLDDPSVKTAAAIKDPSLPEPSTLPDLSNSEGTVEVKTNKKRKWKGKKTEHNVVKSNVNGCGMSENTTTPALDTIQCVSTDAVMEQSCLSLGENEEQDENMLIKDAEKSNGERDVQDDDCNCNPAVENAELFTKESMLDVVKLNMEQSINDNSSNPEEKSGSVKNGSLAKKHDAYLIVNDLSDKFQGVKTYSRKKVLNSTDGDCPSDVNCDKEPTMQDDCKDYSHKFSDGPSTGGLMERETQHSSDQVTSHSRVATGEMELMTEDTSEQRFMSTSSVVDIPVMQLDKTLISNSKKKLLILDLNGLLVDCVITHQARNYHLREPDFQLGKKQVYKRPFCDDFLQFCFERFHVGVWSSRAKFNVDGIIQFLLGESASKLLISWNQSHCTHTQFRTVENPAKPLVLKELRRIWEHRYPGLPWVKGEFNETNTLLLDDSPYKALMNPPHTAIFPYTYRYNHRKDSCLGPGGNLRVYLEGLAMAENVPDYVASNPFGQRPIKETNPSWPFYCKVIQSVKEKKKR